jgi:2-dehydro-3-deoxyphosphogluconate aldolase/(4S)-4-hydroxy-2-oxoglutarate aldolase
MHDSERPDLVERLRVAGLVVVAKPSAPDDMAARVATLVEAGVSAIEVTFRGDGAPAAIERLRESVPDALVGAGTVLTAAQARDAIAAGAEYVVAPGSDPTVIETVLAAGVVMIPGVATASEVSQNLTRGLSLLKVFPAEAVGGIPLLRALRGPFRDVRFIPTGGIGPANLAAYLAEPNVLACGGSWLDDGSHGAELAEKARAAAAIVAARPHPTA